MIQEFRIDRFRLLFDLEPENFESDRNLLWYAQNRQVPEPEVIHVMLRALKAGDNAIDAGANVGFFTVLMSKLVGDGGKVLAVEPDAKNVAKLKKNLDANSCGNVEVLACALGGHSGTGKLYRVSDNGQSSLYGDGEPACAVQIGTLNGALLHLPRRPAFMKMDIEGSEMDALRGCSDLPPIVVCEANAAALERAGSNVRTMVGWMRDQGYGAYVPHASGVVPSLIQSGQKVKPTRGNANLLFAWRSHLVKHLWPEVEL